MKRGVWRVVLLGCLGVMAGAGAGCGSGGGRIDLGVMADRSTPSGTREEMIRRVPEAAASGEIGEGEAYETLKVIVWQRASSPERVRVPAIDAMLRFDGREDETRAMLRLMLPTEPHSARSVVERIAQLAGERGWREHAPALIRRWTRPLGGFEKPIDRPERRALVALFPDRRPGDLVFDYFTGVLDDPDARLLRDPEKARLVAWDLLIALEPDRDRLLARLRSAPSATDDRVLGVLSSAARELDIVPITSSELTWLLRLSERREAWSTARMVVAGLTSEQRASLALRHIPAMVWASEHRRDWLGRTGDDLLAEADGIIRGRETFVRSSEVAGRVHNEAIRDWRDRLSWGDALTIRAALAAITDPRIEAAVFTLAELDRRDTSTEHGGTITPNDSGVFDLIHYPPRATERVGDHVFVASEAMHQESTLSIIHFHLHAQRYNNQAYAGPSSTDLEYAREHQRACIVFTFLNQNTLNADYYQPDGAIIDLGSLTR